MAYILAEEGDSKHISRSEISDSQRWQEKNVITMNQGNSVEISQSGQEKELVYIRLVGKASTKASSGLRPEETSHEKVCGEIVPSRGSNKFKASEARTHLAECKKSNHQQPDHTGSCFST